jgi:hypothetical protein
MDAATSAGRLPANDAWNLSRSKNKNPSLGGRSAAAGIMRETGEERVDRLAPRQVRTVLGEQVVNRPPDGRPAARRPGSSTSRAAGDSSICLMPPALTAGSPGRVGPLGVIEQVPSQEGQLGRGGLLVRVQERRVVAPGQAYQFCARCSPRRANRRLGQSGLILVADQD